MSDPDPTARPLLLAVALMALTVLAVAVLVGGGA